MSRSIARRLVLPLLLALGLSALAAAPAHAEPPSNDAFANATLLGVGEIEATGVNATQEAGEPDPTCVWDPSQSVSVWYRLPERAADFVIETSGVDNPDTVLTVFSGTTLDGLSEVACNDDYKLPSFGSRVGLTTTAGTTYYVRVTFVGDSRDGVHFSIRLSDQVLPHTPTIAGSPRVGRTLTVHVGTWLPGGVTLARQWLRRGVPIPGATAATYRPVAADVGAPLSVKVTGSDELLGSVTAVSAATAPVAKGIITKGSPRIFGLPKVGRKLTAKPGAWKPAGVVLRYRWLRSGRAIRGATNRTYKLTRKDKGHRIKVRVTGSRAGYKTASAVSPATRRVRG